MSDRRWDSGLRAVDFFCGAGGMTHGLLAAGVDVLAGIDRHEPCRATFENPANNRRSTGEAPLFLCRDLAGLSAAELADRLNLRRNDDRLVLAGCSPCQYWSKVRTDRSKSFGSSRLLEEFRRFVAQLRPGYLVFENVPGLRRRIDSSGWGELIELLTGSGYRFDEDVAPLCFHGVPQKRLRYLLIATRVHGAEGSPGLSLPPRDFAAGDFPESMKLKYHLGAHNGFPKLEAGERLDEPAMHWAAKLSIENSARIRTTPRNGGSREAWSHDPALQRKSFEGRDDIFKDAYGRMSWDAPAPTITTRFDSLSNGRFGHPDEDRAISLREGATLQTFPKTYMFPSSTREATRQIGNALPPELARRLGEQLIAHRQSLVENRQGRTYSGAPETGARPAAHATRESHASRT